MPRCPGGDVFAKPIAFNVVAKVGEFEPSGFTGEEAKVMAETPKILDAPDLRVVATSVRVPVVTGSRGVDHGGVRSPGLGR